MKSASRHIFSLARPLLPWAVFGIVLSVATLLSNIALMALSGWFIAAMGLAGLTGTALNYFTPAAAIRGLAILRTGSRYVERVASHDAIFRFIALFRPWFYAGLERLSIRHLEKLAGGELFDRLRSDIAAIEQAYTSLLLPLAAALLSMLGVGIGLYIYNPALAGIEVTLLLLAGLAVPYAVLRASRAAVHRREEAERAMKNAMVDGFDGMAELLAYGADQAMIDDQKRWRDTIAAQSLSLQRHSLLGAACVQLMLGLCIVSALVVGYDALQGGHITLAAFAMLPLLTMACFEIILPLPQAVQAYDRTALAFNRLTQFADTPEKIPPAPLSFEKEINIRDISFGYDAARPLLKNFSLCLKKGEQIALLGPTGCGKSTLLSLLCAIHHPSSGTIEIDGVNTGGVDEEQALPLFSLAAQKPFIFSGTVRRNLTLGQETATDAALDAACRLAGFDEVLAGLAQGYDTFIGNNGATLSGGQVRRLALARALLKPAACLLLDEPDEGLSPEQGTEILARICTHARTKHMSVVIISHKDVSALPLDRVYAFTDKQAIPVT